LFDSVVNMAFHDANTDTDTDILTTSAPGWTHLRILADLSDMSRDFPREDVRVGVDVCVDAVECQLHTTTCCNRNHNWLQLDIQNYRDETRIKCE